MVTCRHYIQARTHAPDLSDVLELLANNESGLRCVSGACDPRATENGQVRTGYADVMQRMGRVPLTPDTTWRQLEIKQPAELGWSIVFCHRMLSFAIFFRCVSGDRKTTETGPAGEGEGRFTGIRRVVRGVGQFVVGDGLRRGDQAADISHRIPNRWLLRSGYRLSSGDLSAAQ